MQWDKPIFSPHRLGQEKGRPAALYVLLIRAPPFNVGACLTHCVSTSANDELPCLDGVNERVLALSPCFLCALYFSKWFVPGTFERSHTTVRVTSTGEFVCIVHGAPLIEASYERSRICTPASYSIRATVTSSRLVGDEGFVLLYSAGTCGPIFGDFEKKKTGSPTIELI